MIVPHPQLSSLAPVIFISIKRFVTERVALVNKSSDGDRKPIVFNYLTIRNLFNYIIISGAMILSLMRCASLCGKLCFDKCAAITSVKCHNAI